MKENVPKTGASSQKQPLRTILSSSKFTKWFNGKASNEPESAESTTTLHISDRGLSQDGKDKPASLQSKTQPQIKSQIQKATTKPPPRAGSREWHRQRTPGAFQYRPWVTALPKTQFKQLDSFTYLEDLPLEILKKILAYVDLDTIKALRLTSWEWLLVAQEFLIPHVFVLRADRIDLHVLKFFARHPIFNHRVRELQFSHGEIDEVHARQNIYAILSQLDVDNRLKVQTASWDVYSNLKKLQDHYLRMSCNLEGLISAFESLTNLDSITVTLETYPFGNKSDPAKVLPALWDMPSTRSLPRHDTVYRFACILLAVAGNTHALRIKNISHDRLPLEYFAHGAQVIETTATAFAQLITLDLTLDCAHEALNRLDDNPLYHLAFCLRQAPSLSTLRLAFQGRKKTDITLLLSSLHEHKFVWKGLTKITLEGVVVSETNLSTLLINQPQLSSINLGGRGRTSEYEVANAGVHLKNGSFAGFFETVWTRFGWQLEEFKLQGDLIGLESGERWILDQAEDQCKIYEFVTD